MAATINTNLASINAQRNLALSGQSLNTTMQRLSSGLRVNSAKDDAAGLAIAERMSTQVRGLTVASRNANDGISLAQTAEGALGKVGDMLQRMRELAVQASNATNSASDRTALQAEVSQLAAEIDRVAKQTNFNGQKILDGSFAGAVFQVGANSGDNVTLGALADVRSSKLSLVNYAQGMVALSANDDPKPAIANYATGIAAGELRITVGTTPPQSIALEAIKPAISSLERLGQVVTAINNRSTDTGVVAFMQRNDATGNYEIQFMSEKTDAVGKPLSIGFEGFSQSTTGIGPSSTSGVKSFSPVPALNAVAAPAAFLMTEQGGYVETPKLAAVVNYRDHLSSINEGLGMDPAVFELKELNQAISNYQSAAAQSPVDSLALDAAAADINEALATLQNLRQSGTFESDMNALIKNNNALAQTNPNALMASLSSESTPQDVANAVTLLKEYGVSTSGFKLSKFQDGNAWSTESGKTVDDALAALGNLVSEQVSGGLNLTAADHATNVRGLDTIDVTSQEGAWIGLKKIDSAIDQINASRATLGAMQTRFETAVNNIDIQVENLSAARGRIMDADFAVETANLSRTKILQEAGTAMVAQANQIPQNVLKLLQG